MILPLPTQNPDGPQLPEWWLLFNVQETWLKDAEFRAASACGFPRARLTSSSVSCSTSDI